MNELLRKSDLRLTRQGKHFDPNDFLGLEEVYMYSAYWNATKCINNSFGSNIYLNLNPSVKFFQERTIYEEMEAIGFDNQRRIKKAIKDRHMMTIYNNRVYKIDDIEFKMTPNDKFFCDMHHKNKETTYSDYILDNYKMKVTYPDQPLLRHRNKHTKQDIYFIPEF